MTDPETRLSEAAKQCELAADELPTQIQSDTARALAALIHNLETSAERVRDADVGELIADGGQPADEPETFETVTVMQATDGDQQVVVIGEQQEARELAEPEVLEDGTITRVRRVYEPVQTCPTGEPRTAREIREWLDENRDLHAFEEYDWDAHDERELLAAIVDNRAQHRQTLGNINERLDAIQARTSTIGASERVSDLREDIRAMLVGGEPTMVDRTPDEDGEDDD